MLVLNDNGSTKLCPAAAGGTAMPVTLHSFASPTAGNTFAATLAVAVVTSAGAPAHTRQLRSQPGPELATSVSVPVALTARRAESSTANARKALSDPGNCVIARR